MRHHFHRCAHLRVIEIKGSDRSATRWRGAEIADELCDARKLAPCLGLAECDVLGLAQKRELLVARATRLRDEEGGSSRLADARHAGDARAEALSALAEELAEERDEIAAQNRRLRAESGAAVLRNPRPLRPSEAAELPVVGASVSLDDELRGLRAARLDAIDRALDAIARGSRLACARCARPIELERLREAPDTALCNTCAEEALPPDPG